MTVHSHEVPVLLRTKGCLQHREDTFCCSIRWLGQYDVLDCNRPMWKLGAVLLPPVQSVNVRLTSTAFAKYMLSSAFEAARIATLSRKKKLFNKLTVTEVGLISATYLGWKEYLGSLKSADTST